jgi:hypothetical protein
MMQPMLSEQTGTSEIQHVKLVKIINRIQWDKVVNTLFHQARIERIFEEEIFKNSQWAGSCGVKNQERKQRSRMKADV